MRSRDVAPFSRIEVRGSTEVTVARGRQTALRLEGGANRIHDLRTWVEGGTLVVEGKDTSGTIDTSGQVERLRSRVDGAGSLHLTALRAEDAAVAISGSGSADIGESERLQAEIDGSASITYAGDPVLSEAVSGSGEVERPGT